jgi:hypothetical protein
MAKANVMSVSVLLRRAVQPWTTARQTRREVAQTLAHASPRDVENERPDHLRSEAQD